ncbi:MAG: glycosyltransferase family 2 protein [Candidatus Rokuibacteriota bacterium]
MSRVSAAVVSLNTRELTLRCLAATERAAAGLGMGLSTVLTLVDNGSSDGTVEAALRAHPGWRVLVLADNPGYGAALNRAFASAPADFYLALNADVLLEPDALARLLTLLEREPRCGLAGPTLTYPDGATQPSAKRLPDLGWALGEALWLYRLRPSSARARHFYYADAPEVPDVVDAVSGAAMLIRGAAFTRVGGFDEGFRMYFEETDLCRRLAAAAFTVRLDRGARAVHWHAASTRQTTVREVEYWLSYVRFFAKHEGAGAARTLSAVVAFATVVRMAALVAKYPPVGRARAAMLGVKLDACRRLLGGLRRLPDAGQVAGAPS